MHLIVGVIFCMAGVYVLVRFVLFRNEDIFKIKEHPEITELKREIKAWKQAVQGIPNSYSAEEDVIHQTIDRKILHLEQKLNRKLHMETLSKDIYMTTLLELKNKVYLAYLTNEHLMCIYMYAVCIIHFISCLQYSFLSATKYCL